MNTHSSNPISNNCHERKNHCFSWSAVFIGAFFGIGISFLLNLFGVAIGLSAFSSASPQTLAIGGIIALVIIAIFSMGILGWIAGYIGATKRLCDHNHQQCNYGCIYGFGAWCVALILSMLLAMPTTHFISESVRMLNPSIKYTQMSSQSLLASDADNTANTTTSTDAENQVAQTKVSMDDETHKTLTTTTFIAFIIFFIGALSACIGGHCGYNRYTRCEEIK